MTDVPSFQTALNARSESGNGELQDLTAICPHCGIAAGFDKTNVAGPPNKTYLEMTSEQREQVIHEISVRCRACLGLIIVTRNVADKSMRERLGFAPMEKWYFRLLWPIPVHPDRAPLDLSPEIRKPYDEARKIVAVSHSGAAVLARRCVQQIIRGKLKITRKQLFPEIQEAIKRPELSKPTADALDHVREIGNFAAHPDVDQADVLVEVDFDDAVYTLEVVEMLFDDLFRKPQKLSVMTNRIAEKKIGTTQPASD